MIEVRRATTTADIDAAAQLFDQQPQDEASARFLDDCVHHLLLAWDDRVAVGFVSGVEMTHPDKGTEMFLYELGVAAGAQRRGVGRTLVGALRELARERGCYGMWVLTDRGNTAALATYRSAGAGEPADQVMLDWSF